VIESQQELEARLRLVLRQAASELAVPPAVWAGPSSAGSRSGRRLSAGALLGRLGVAMSVGVTVAIVLGALILLGGHGRPTANTAVNGRLQLINRIGVLRRPQTKADRTVEKALRVPAGARVLVSRAPDLPLVRFARTTPWGQKLYLVPFKPLSAEQLVKIHSSYPKLASLGGARLRKETLELFGSPGGFRGGVGGTAATIEAGREIAFEAAGRELAVGAGATATRLIVVVPDGVAKVEFVVPRQPFLGTYGAPIYKHSLSKTVPVQNNIAATQVNRDASAGLGPRTTAVAMIWFASDGRVIKRIGDLAAANRVIPPPRPGPQTPRSRAAERNPSTPNPVWITPRTGGPHTDFIDHFRQLLNNSGYSFRLTGTSCPTIQIINDVSSTAGPNAKTLRGRIWNNSVAEGGTWCPGTYHLSIAVTVSAPNGNLKHIARPFGTATFTVHR
jgi:hypothetical protein